MINKLTDVFPYFRFLRYAPWFVASHFKEFITKVEKNDAIQAGRTADAALSKILLRRKKDDLLEGKPLVDLVRPFVSRGTNHLADAVRSCAEVQDDGTYRAAL